jgi:hypothetical protein
MKKSLVFIGIIIAIIIMSCNKSQKPKEKKRKWTEQEFEEGLKLHPFPDELIYPNAEGEKLQITTDEREKEIILSTIDNLNKIDKYYEQNLPKHGWKKVIEGSYKNSKKSYLYYEKGNREALINISPDNNDKTEIIVLLRPAD